MSITLAAISLLIAHAAPIILVELRNTVFNKSREAIGDEGKALITTKGNKLVRGIIHLDEKEQTRHLEQALKNALERGLIPFTTLQERDQYRTILYTLMEMGPQSELIRKQALQIFTLSDTPDFTELNDKYNRSQQRTALAKHEQYTEIDTKPYLTSFFNALLAELYADPFFRQQMSNIIQLRATRSIQQSLLDVITLLQQLEETLEDNYTAAQFAQDVEIYTDHIKRTFHTLKIVGIVPKDKTKDPELKNIYVPLRIILDEQNISEKQPDEVIEVLKNHSYLVLLGGPGFGKSTITRYLAWSHAAANPESLLPERPLPLRIELRRLSEERKQDNYNFLSFATEVLLRREGIEIDQRMFKELLARRMLLLLFDGLDEVATPDERIRLVEEIEHFVQSYPGNYVLVTSRPVGYDLAHFSNQLFSHALIQPLNDTQIQQFLVNWYTYVLDLSPIPQTELQEMELLVKTLQENMRLHKLAENPLLLTVITELHRYERLPDRRVLVYDRCADLLLETWAKTKGTHKRWIDMKMVKEDQYACVAHLGFVLHQRSQEEQLQGKTKPQDEITSDVTARVMLQEIEYFLKSRNLIAEGAQQRAEAKLLIDLMKIEAGLIVERGTEENGEALYGFVHRTFQEYFAAADVYERFQQEVDLTIVRDFLVENLHDPHWREVTLLLLGKLKPKPVTNLLRSLLQRKTKTRRSLGTPVLQQDLFFICDCLVEEIAVENELIEQVTLCLKTIIKTSFFFNQKVEALNYLGKLVQTRQYTHHGRDTLIYLGSVNNDMIIQIRAIQVLYGSSKSGSQEQQFATTMLMQLLQRPNLSIDQAWQTAASLYRSSRSGSQEQQFATTMLMQLLQRPDLSIDQVRQTAESLYRSSKSGSQERQFATTILLSLTRQLDLSGNWNTLYNILRSEVPQFHKINTNLIISNDLSEL